MASQQVLTALEDLHRELEKLQPAVKHIEMAGQVIKALDSVQVRHLQFVDEIRMEDASHRKQLAEVSKLMVSELNEENKKQLSITGNMQQQVMLEQKYLSELREKVENYYHVIDQINFPNRLDKMDNTVSGTILAVQSMQNRLENLERNLADRLREGFEQEKQAQAALLQIQNESFKKQRVYARITWTVILVAAAIIATVIILKK